MKKESYYWLFFFVILYFPIFMHLETLPVGIWDESLFSLRAYNFYEFGTYLDDFANFEGLYHHRNTKLPFTTIIQAGFMKLMGANELALRLPIAIIFLLAVGFILYYYNKLTKSYFIGVVFALLLVCSTGWVRPHMLRTGDQDVPFACYLLFSVVFFYRFLKSGKTKEILWFSFWMLAALLTKNILAGIVVVGLGLYVLIDKKLLKLLANWKVYFGVLVVALVYIGCLLYYDWRFPGFIDQMWNYELGGRYAQTIENHDHTWTFYLNMMFGEMMPFGAFIPWSIALFWDRKLVGWTREYLMLFHCVFWIYLMVLSFSSTKVYWYASPLFVFGAMIVSLSFYHIWTTYFSGRRRLKKGMIAAAIFYLALPYYEVVNSVYIPNLEGNDEFCKKCILSTMKRYPDTKKFNLVSNNWGSASVWYAKSTEDMNPEYDVKFTRSYIHPKDTYIMTTVDHAYRGIVQHSEVEMLYEDKKCRFFKIIGDKKK